MIQWGRITPAMTRKDLDDIDKIHDLIFTLEMANSYYELVCQGEDMMIRDRIKNTLVNARSADGLSNLGNCTYVMNKFKTILATQP